MIVDKKNSKANMLTKMKRKNSVLRISILRGNLPRSS